MIEARLNLKVRTRISRKRTVAPSLAKALCGAVHLLHLLLLLLLLLLFICSPTAARLLHLLLLNRSSTAANLLSTPTECQSGRLNGKRWSWWQLKNAVPPTHGSPCISAMMNHGMALVARLLQALRNAYVRFGCSVPAGEVRKIPKRPKSRHTRGSKIKCLAADPLRSLFAFGGLHRNLRAGLIAMTYPAFCRARMWSSKWPSVSLARCILNRHSSAKCCCISLAGLQTSSLDRVGPVLVHLELHPKPLRLGASIWGSFARCSMGLLHVLDGLGFLTIWWSPQTCSSLPETLAKMRASS